MKFSSENAKPEKEKKVVEKKEDKQVERSPSIEVIPSTSRLKSQVVIPEKSTVCFFN